MRGAGGDDPEADAASAATPGGGADAGAWSGDVESAAARARAQELVRGYVAEARVEQRHHRAALEAIRQRPRVHRRHWLSALGVIMLAAAIGAALLMRPEDDATRAAVAAGAARCLERQSEVMRAVVQYRRERGAPPPDLGALRPRYLRVDPVDPETGQPYVYTRHGDIASVSCPLHRNQPVAPIGAGTPLPRKSYDVTPK